VDQSGTIMTAGPAGARAQVRGFSPATAQGGCYSPCSVPAFPSDGTFFIRRAFKFHPPGVQGVMPYHLHRRRPVHPTSTIRGAKIMSLEETRLDLAVRLSARALRSEQDAPVGPRLAAFRDAYAAIAALDAGDEAWTEETLLAAWSLTEPAHPRGGPVAALAADLAAAHAAVLATARRPPPGRPTRPRRDA
jgi:hypothetical protein